MTDPPNGISAHTPADVETWLRREQQQVYIGEALNEKNSESMGADIVRYGPGESHAWAVTYDEVLVVTSGTFSLIAGGVRMTAKAGEFLFLRKGTECVYAAGDEGAELVFVTYPHTTQTDLATKHADLYNTFQPTAEAPPRFANGRAEEHIALLERIYGPFERGESYDFQPFFDALTDDAVLEFHGAALRGKRAIIGYFTHGSEFMEFRPFDRPLQYFGAGDRVVQLGHEKFRVKATGATHECEWAWVFHFDGAMIYRIVAIMDLSGISDVVAEIATKAQTEADAA